MFTQANYDRSKKSFGLYVIDSVYRSIKSIDFIDFIDSDGIMYLKVGSLIEISIIITCSNNIIFRKVNVKPYGLNKVFMGNDLIEDKLYQIVDQLNER